VLNPFVVGGICVSAVAYVTGLLDAAAIHFLVFGSRFLQKFGADRGGGLLCQEHIPLNPPCSARLL
jgi:hypothetical protein